MGWKRSGAVLLYAALLLTAAAAAAPQVDREPVFLKDFPFTPEDGTVLSVNPPAFVFTRPADWKPGKYTYRLEYAADPQFRNATRVRLDRHMYIPGRKLTPGTWFWRYAVLSPEQSPVWSKSRRFVVPPDIPEYAFPNLDTVAAHIPAQHPRLMVTAAMIPEIRRRAAEGDLREFTRDLCNRLRPHIDRELVPEPEFLPPRSNGSQQKARTAGTPGNVPQSKTGTALPPRPVRTGAKADTGAGAASPGTGARTASCAQTGTAAERPDTSFDLPAPETWKAGAPRLRNRRRAPDTPPFPLRFPNHGQWRSPDTIYF